jgi:hypothetical protein
VKRPDLYTKLPDRLKAIYPKDLFRKIPPAFRDLAFDYLTISPTDYPFDLPAFVAIRDSLLRALQAAGVVDPDGRIVPMVNPIEQRTRELPVASGGPNDYDFDHLEVDCPIAVDLGCHSVEEGRATWGKRYLVLPDGQHGPAKFETKEEKDRFCKLSGQREKRAY